LEASIKVNSKTVNPKKLVYEAMHWPVPFFDLKDASSSTIGSPASIVGDYYANVDSFGTVSL